MPVVTSTLAPPDRGASFYRFLRLVVVGLVSLALVYGALPVLGKDAFVVVVHPAAPAQSLAKAQVSDYFLKKTVAWQDGTAVQPVTVADRTVREAFSAEIHQRGDSAIKKFWQRQIFTGSGTPPPELKTDQEVLSFVRANRGAIGFVSGDADVASAGVKVLDIR